MASQSGTTYSHTGLSVGSTRHYRVRAINSVGNSGWSNTANATTGAATVPGVPTSLSATPDGQTAIDLSWTAPASNGGATISGYRIEVSTDGGANFSQLVASQSGTTYSHTGLSPGSTRHYRIRALNVVGPSLPSNVASATTANSGLATVMFASPSASIDESAGIHQVAVTLSNPSNMSLVLKYNLSGTATEVDDYTIQGSGTTAVPANATSAEIPIKIIDDPEDEENETVIFTLTQGTGYQLGRTNVFTLTITDNDVLPLTFAYPISDQSYQLRLPIKDLMLPEAENGTPPYTYQLTPELPRGLNFDASSRILSGAPMEVVPPKTFTYSVTDTHGGMTMQTFTIEVVQPEAFIFADTVSYLAYPVEIPLTDVVLPFATGGTPPYTYTLTPELPTGLTFDPETRSLSGTPTEVAAVKTYTYAVEDHAGIRIQMDFSLEVYQMSFTETIPDQSYPRDLPIAPLILPEVTGGVSPVQYTLTLLDLPVGLRFDLPLRKISGIPYEVTPLVQLTYMATDANGAQDSLMFSIEVISPVNAEQSAEIPTEFQIYPNYPNPFQNTTHLVFDLPRSAQVWVEVLDVTGRRMIATPTVHLTAGWKHEIELDALRIPSGTYLYRICTASLEDSQLSAYTGHFVRVQ